MKAEDQPSSAAFRIVVIEDTPDMAESIAEILRRANLEAHLAVDAETGLELAKELPADLVILDVTLPGIDGFEACRRLRTFSDCYVIMLTGQAGEVDRLAGLTAGADDYMTKPFYPRELIARITAMRRRPRPAESKPPVRGFGALEIDPRTQKVRLDERSIELSQIEFRLLNVLSASPNRTVTRSELLEQVWGADWIGSDHLVDVHISNLRRKLGEDPGRPRYITTVRGRGFSMGTG
jgi:DNA-binding response OmpR family regulator